jgi:Bacterial regulatory helix-turn-helix protein, lysR family
VAGGIGAGLEGPLGGARLVSYPARRYVEAMKDIFALKLFTRVARLGSFSAAARETGLSQSQASRNQA